MRRQVEDIRLFIRKISDKARKQEHDVIRLDMGEPFYDTPQPVKEYVKEALEEEQSYAPASGLDELKDAVVEEEGMKNGYSSAELRLENVQVTSGGISGIFAVFSAMLGHDDKAVFNDPCWGPYKLLSEVNGHRYEQVRYFDEDGLTDKARKALKEAELALVNTPSNPLGRMLTKEEAKEFAEVCEDYDTFLLSDEVYHRLNFDREHYSPAVYAEKSAVIGSVSKNHAMTGWRVGWILAREEDNRQFLKTSRAILSSTPRISQRAAVYALGNDSHVEKIREGYRETRDIAVERIEDLGWDYVNPHGGMFVFPDVGHDSWDFCLEMVEKGVAMVPGEPFGPKSDENVRICFGSSTKEEVEKAFDILEEET